MELHWILGRNGDVSLNGTESESSRKELFFQNFIWKKIPLNSQISIFFTKSKSIFPNKQLMQNFNPFSIFEVGETWQRM